MQACSVVSSMVCIMDCVSMMPATRTRAAALLQSHSHDSICATLWHVVRDDSPPTQLHLTLCCTCSLAHCIKWLDLAGHMSVIAHNRSVKYECTSLHIISPTWATWIQEVAYCQFHSLKWYDKKAQQVSCIQTAHTQTTLPCRCSYVCKFTRTVSK